MQNIEANGAKKEGIGGSECSKSVRRKSVKIYDITRELRNRQTQDFSSFLLTGKRGLLKNFTSFDTQSRVQDGFSALHHAVC